MYDPTVVITPPGPIMTPADVPGSHAANDPRIAALIQAATEELDGPGGWLGRALGPQTLELRLRDFERCGRRGEIILSYPPLIEIESISYDAPDGTVETVDPADYRVGSTPSVLPKSGLVWPPVAADGEARIRYRAGYDGTTTGEMPERVKQAIILAVNEMNSAGAENLFLAERTIEGVGSRRWVVSPAAGEVIRRTVDRLLASLRVYS